MSGAAKKSNDALRPGSRNVIERVQEAWGESPFYQAKLRGPAPDRLLYQPQSVYTPDKNLAQALANGRLSFGDETIDCEGELECIWARAAPGGALYSFLQEFKWMAHLEAVGEGSQAIARTLMRSWLDRYERWSSQAWSPYLTSERLLQLCAHHPLVLSRADAMWRSRVLSTMARQTRHLALTAHRADTGFDRLMTSLGLSIAGYCLPGCEGAAARGMEMARRELRLQLRADGGHVSRSPSRQLMLAVRLQALLKTIEARGIQPPGFLRHTVMRASAMAAFFRCPDGKLAVFNGGYEDDPRAVIAIHKFLDGDLAQSSFARHSGYHKLAAGRAVTIIDTGDDSSSQIFKSAGSFHFSSGRSRIIVNCGNGGHRASKWRQALEQRAAHSALSFNEEAGAKPIFGAVSHRRAEDSHGQLLEFERQLISSTGEDARYTRRIYLAIGGANIRGEELLEGMPKGDLAKAVWRFHLHPSLRASLARDKRSVILLLPNKEGWRLKSNCPVLDLEKSIYCGEGGPPVATEQIVIKASEFEASQEGAAAIRVKWALQRLDAV